MIIAVTSHGKDLDGEVDPRFGRAKHFLLVDTETMHFQVVENHQSLNLPQGAGIQAAQNLTNHRAEVVLTGNCGPKAFKTLQAAGIEIVVGVKGKIGDAIQTYLRGEFERAEEANVEGHWV
ncbi:MAG: NifB/NifX family molybdenum-iron cluster-binding protein [Deltaproteobacteria bacterium]|nr:MAG: NifB/NifX family molybdenum-iron cluster-binding protein [Deltaproteobacteria bacterium]